MLPGWHPVAQAGLGTLFTWGLTAAGSALVFIFSSGQRRILDGSLGFAAGVMTAASYWSLLAPAIEMAEDSGLYGAKGQWAFVPVGIGFTLGALFVYGADILMPYLGISNPTTAFALELGPKVDKDDPGIFDTNNMQHEPSADNNFIGSAEPARQARSSVVTTNPSEVTTSPSQRRRPTAQVDTVGSAPGDQHSANNILLDTATAAETSSERSRVSWKRIMLLIIAITIHNIPEGLAVGVGFGAIGKTASATFEKARNLAIGIGIQNFPEGLAVSLPLRGAGMSVWKSFWYGQLSGMVEPVAGLLGALAVVVAEPVLPYALAFAAGAMIYVVVDDIVPEAQTSGNGTLASWGAVLGFVVMMSLDVGLG